MTIQTATAKPCIPCEDCISNGEPWPEDWGSAELREELGAHLCDGCFDDRLDQISAQDDWDDAHGISGHEAEMNEASMYYIENDLHDL